MHRREGGQEAAQEAGQGGAKGQAGGPGRAGAEAVPRVRAGGGAAGALPDGRQPAVAHGVRPLLEGRERGRGGRGRRSPPLPLRRALEGKVVGPLLSLSQARTFFGSRWLPPRLEWGG